MGRRVREHRRRAEDIGASRRWRRLPALLAVVAASVALASGCVGSGKVARVDDIGPLPPEMHVVWDGSQGCRQGESGFDYRFVVLEGSTDLTGQGPLLRALQANGFYHSQGMAEDLPWIAVAYQQSRYPLRAEVGLLSQYLSRQVPWDGPDPASLPAAARQRPERHVLVALRPTDFTCATPL